MKKSFFRDVFLRTVITEVCSSDQKWSARLAQVIRQSLCKSIFWASRTTKMFKVVRAPEKFGNHCVRITFNEVITLTSSSPVLKIWHKSCLRFRWYFILAPKIVKQRCLTGFPYLCFICCSTTKRCALAVQNSFFLNWWKFIRNRNFGS